MPPLPKKKHSKGRKGKRASHHGLKRIAVSACSHCGAAARPHQVCPSCGYYNGREVVPIDSPEVA